MTYFHDEAELRPFFIIIISCVKLEEAYSGHTEMVVHRGSRAEIPRTGLFSTCNNNKFSAPCRPGTVCQEDPKNASQAQPLDSCLFFFKTERTGRQGLAKVSSTREGDPTL